MLAPPDPSQVVAFSQSQVADPQRPNKRREIDEDGVIEVEDEDGGVEVEGGMLWETPREEIKGKEIPESVCEFTSIKQLRRIAKKGGHTGTSTRSFSIDLMH